jgi:hypothetical protein
MGQKQTEGASRGPIKRHGERVREKGVRMKARTILVIPGEPLRYGTEPNPRCHHYPLQIGGASDRAGR